MRKPNDCPVCGEQFCVLSELCEHLVNSVTCLPRRYAALHTRSCWCGRGYFLNSEDRELRKHLIENGGAYVHYCDILMAAT